MKREDLYLTDEESEDICNRNSAHSVMVQTRLATHRAVDNAVKKIVAELEATIYHHSPRMRLPAVYRFIEALKKLTEE